MFSFISSSNPRTKDGICSTSERRTGMSRPDKYEMQRDVAIIQLEAERCIMTKTGGFVR